MPSSEVSPIGVIPARLDSTRLERKLLLDRTGKPLIQHTWEAARRSELLDRLVVATDSDEIEQACRGFGACVVRTGPHSSGTDRVAEVARNLELASDTPVLNIQGDEPDLQPQDLDRLVVACRLHAFATLGTDLESGDSFNVNVVKMLADHRGYAEHFWRDPLQAPKRLPDGRLYRHVGVYGYQVHFLHWFSGLEPTVSEQSVRLEQLRALDHGVRIRVLYSASSGRSIDTSQDYEDFVRQGLADSG